MIDERIMQEFLVPATQHLFEATIAEYLWLPWKHAQQQHEAMGSSQVRHQQPSCMRVCVYA